MIKPILTYINNRRIASRRERLKELMALRDKDNAAIPNSDDEHRAIIYRIQATSREIYKLRAEIAELEVKNGKHT